jgi:hypothetical protein
MIKKQIQDIRIKKQPQKHVRSNLTFFKKEVWS